jgi:hypothetical protein
MDDASKYYGEKILAATIQNEDTLTLSLGNGKSIDIWDNGQSCCEYRYMTTDDDVNSLVGHTLKAIEVKLAPGDEGGYAVHEIAFVEITTDQNHIVLCNHNVHNGYYGGFVLTVTER